MTVAALAFTCFIISARMPSILRLNSSRRASASAIVFLASSTLPPSSCCSSTALWSFRRWRIVDRGVDSIVKAPERGVIRRRGDIVDDCCDPGARSLRLPIDIGTESLERFQMRGVARLVRRVLHFGDDHPAYLQRTLERVDVRARQIAVGGNIAIGQF